MRSILLAAILWAGAQGVAAQSQNGALPELPSADIYVLGEIHDNPTHHVAQAALVTAIAPRALVMEMLTDVQAARITSETPRDAATLDDLLDWSEGGWPDIAMYAPIMVAAGGAPVRGASGEAGDLRAFGLDAPLPPGEQAAREALQQAAHCDGLPEGMLPEFVGRQRFMDALFASRTIEAYDQFGGPVVLIAGNGHARSDWGVPAAIARVRPDLSVVSVIQSEPGQEILPGDVALTAEPPADRPDPCDAFR